MRAQQMEYLLREIQAFMQSEMKGKGVDDYSVSMYRMFSSKIDNVLDRSPSGGMVDTKHSKCFASRRPGSSPGKGTTNLLFGQVPGSATSHPDR